MKTLYQQLSETSKGQLNASARRYPSTISLLMIELNTQTSWLDMSVDAANTVIKHTSEEEFGILSLSRLFKGQD